MSAEASNHDRAEKLIGGWVAGTLTKEERKLLLDASLSNQALFDALADEEGMRELLADPTVRRQLSALLATSSQPVAAAPASLETWWRWLFRPAPIAAFSAGVLAVLAFVVVRPAFIEKPAPSVAAVGASSEAKAMDMAAPPPAPAEEKPRNSVAALRQDELRRNAPAAVRPAPLNPAVIVDKLAKAAEPVDVAASSSNKMRENEAKPALPAQAPLTPPPSASAPAKKAEEARSEAVSVTAAAPPLVVQPFQDQATTISAPVLGERADDAKAKRAPAAPVATPIRYRVERQQPGGEWVEFGGELSPGTRARVAVDSTQAGQLTIRSGSQTLSLAVTPRQTVHFPAEGNLPAGRGEREVAILFQPGPGLQDAADSSLRQTAQTRYRTMQQQAQPGGGPMAGIGGTQQASQQKDSTVVAAPGDYSVTVRLRYR